MSKDRDRIESAVMVHLSRPAEFEATDKVYMSQILALHPDLLEFIHHHHYHEADSTEHLVLDALAFNTAPIQKALIKDCKFSIVAYLDKKAKVLDVKMQAKQLMDKVMKDVEVIG